MSQFKLISVDGFNTELKKKPKKIKERGNTPLSPSKCVFPTGHVDMTFYQYTMAPKKKATAKLEMHAPPGLANISPFEQVIMPPTDIPGQMGFTLKIPKPMKCVQGIPYCQLADTVAEFYLTELQYFYATQKNGFLARTHEFYHRKIEGLALTMLKFAVAAILGELRHLRMMKDRSYPLAREFFKDYADLCKSLNASQAIRAAATGRESIYSLKIEEPRWMDVIRLGVRGFNQRAWKGSYGGKNWQLIAIECEKLYWEICNANLPRMILKFDRVVNLAHNCGTFLNKFNCHECEWGDDLYLAAKIERILKWHSKGEVGELTKYLNASRFKWAYGECTHTIFIPRRKDEKKEKEKAKG